MKEEILDEIKHSEFILRTKVIGITENIIGIIFCIEIISVLYVFLNELINGEYPLFENLLSFFFFFMTLCLPAIYVLSWRQKSLNIEKEGGMLNINPLWLFTSTLSGGVSIFFGSLLLFGMFPQINTWLQIWQCFFLLLLIIFGMSYLFYVWKTKVQTDKWNFFQEKS